MKLSYKQIEPFVKKPDPKARAILIYGPDDGLMRERTKIIAKTITEDLNDPFNACFLTGDQIAEEPSKLFDEANAMSMMGGDRVVIIETSVESNAKALGEYLENPSENNLIIVQGGDLGPRSGLRSLFEKAGNAAALPCYVQDGYALTNVIQDHLRENGLSIDGDALQYLSQNLTGDHGQLRSELEKLVTYMGQEKQVSLADAMSNTGSLSEQKLDDLVYACAGGNTSRAEKLLDGLLNEGTSAVFILRSLQNHFRKLLYVRLLHETGTPMDAAIKAIKPPLFFKLVDPFKSQLQKWSSEKILSTLKKINELEIDMKKTETASDLLLVRSIFGLSLSAR